MATVYATLTGTNSSTTLTVGLSGAAGTVTYQWQNSSSAGGTFSNISGATSAAFNYSSYTDSATHPYIRPVVTYTPSGVVSATVYSDIAVIKVYKDSNNNTKIDITFGSDIKSIGYNAFISCTSLATIDFGSVTTIGQQAFYACSSLANIDFGSVTSIGSSAFTFCTSLANVAIGDSVTSIGQGAFVYCTSLATITVSTGNTTFFTDSRGILYQITDATNQKVTAVLCPPATTITNITIDTVTKNGTTEPVYTVTSIGDSAFRSCTSLAILTIGDSVTSIGNSAFAFCTSLATIDFGSVTSIGSYAFRSCTSLTNIDFGSVTSIGSYAFAFCTSLATIDFGSVTTIGQQAFYACSSLANIDFGSVTSIGSYAFDNCTSLASVVIGDSVTSIGQSAFDNCTSLANIYFLGAKPNTDAFSKSPVDTAYYRHIHDSTWNTTISGISKIRHIPTISTITRDNTTGEYTITGSCDANLSPVLVYISSNDGRTWRKYNATKDNVSTTTWYLETDSITTRSIKVSTIANYYDESKNTDGYIYCKSEQNGTYSPTTDTSLSTFTIGGEDQDEEDFEVSLYGTVSVEVTARATVDEGSDGNNTDKAAVFIQVNDGDPTKLGYAVDYTKNINLNPGENTITITVKNPRSTGDEVDYTGYIHVLPGAPAIATTFTTGYTNDNTPTLSGTTDAALDTNGDNTTVTLYTVTTGTIAEEGENTTTYTYTFLGEAEVTAATGNGKTQWTFTPTDAFTDGTYTIVATAQYSRSVIEDDANNKFESEYSNTITFTVDTVAPNKPVIVLTSKPDLISGTAEANSTVLVKDTASDQVATATVNPAGVWTLNIASISSYSPAKYSYVGQDTALNVSDATTFDTSGFTIKYPPISIKAGQEVKRVIPSITGRSVSDTSTVFTVTNQNALKKRGAKASIDPNTGRLTVTGSVKNLTDKIIEKITVTVKASSPIYGTKYATVKIRIT